MRVITVNNKNITSVYGKLKKFFCNKNHTRFEAFHNFNCGFHHISPMPEDYPGEADIIREYPCTMPSEVILRPCYLDKNKMIIVVSSCSIIIEEGNQIVLSGDRLIIKSGWFYEDVHMYTVVTKKPWNHNLHMLEMEGEEEETEMQLLVS